MGISFYYQARPPEIELLDALGTVMDVLQSMAELEEAGISIEENWPGLADDVLNGAEQLIRMGNEVIADHGYIRVQDD